MCHSFFSGLKGGFALFLKTLDGSLINSRYITRICIKPNGKGDDYQCTDVIAEMDANSDATLASFDSGDIDFDGEDAKNFLRSLVKKLNQQNVFINNSIIPVADCGG